MQRALRLAAEELSVANVEDIIALAQAFCKLRIWPDFAIDFFRQEYQDFTIDKVRGRFLVRTLPSGG
jgi:hypothetical protein